MDVFVEVVRSSGAYLWGCVAEAAHALDVFAALSRPMDAASLAGQLGARGEARLERLLEAMAWAGWLERDAEGYRRRGEPPARPEVVAPTGWGRLAEVIREDAPLPSPEGEGAAGEALERYHAQLWEGGEAAAKEVAAEGLGAGARLLDAGGGAGVYSAAWLERHPEGRVVLLDRPAVAALARERLRRFGERARVVEGDLWSWRGEERFDRALLANVTHLYGAERCEALFEVMSGRIAAGGRLVVKDFRMRPDRSGPEVGLLFSLNMALYTASGRVHAEAWQSDALRGLGFTDVRVAELATSPEAMMVIGGR